MRIGLVIDRFDPRRGGAEQWTFQHAQQLLARGHEVHVISREIGGLAAELPVVAHRLGSASSAMAKAEAVERELSRLNLDVVLDSGLDWHGQILLSHDGSRIALWEQKLRMLPPFLRPFKRLLMKTLPRYTNSRRLMERQFGDPSRIIVALSEMCAHDFQRYHGVSPDRIRLIYNGVDCRRFSPDSCSRHRAAIREELGIAGDEIAFVFVGHNYRLKGLATAIRAVERLAADGGRARLVAVGGKGRAGSMRLSPEQSRLVAFVGSVGDTVPYYAAADAFVLPTFYDPCSLSVLEAAACGLPCVTTRFNGAGELLHEGVEGFVCDDPADDRQLANRMRTLLDPAIRRRMSEAARQLALEHTLEQNCDDLLTVYQEVATRKADTSPHVNQ